MLNIAPVLITPNFEKPLVIQCDASTQGIGGILAQEDEEDAERPIAFYSYKLNKPQRNYSTTELECLAVMKCIENFREYVEGLPFKIVTDHASFQWLMRQTDLNGRLARWSLKLQGFDFGIEHRKGSLNTVSDALSRLCLEEIVVDYESEVDLDSEFFNSVDYVKLRNNIGENKLMFPDLRAVDKFVYKRTQFSDGDRVRETMSWKLWIAQELTDATIYRAHCPPTSAHGGVGKTLERLRRNFF